MDKPMDNYQHSGTELSNNDQNGSFGANIFQVSVTLLGFSPFLLFATANLIMLCEGRCQPHIWSGKLGLFSLVLWSGEVLSGFLCLFSKRIRPLANTLLITLLVSLVLSFLAILLSFPALLCLHIVF